MSYLIERKQDLSKSASVNIEYTPNLKHCFLIWSSDNKLIKYQTGYKSQKEAVKNAKIAAKKLGFTDTIDCEYLDLL